MLIKDKLLKDIEHINKEKNLILENKSELSSYLLDSDDKESIIELIDENLENIKSCLDKFKDSKLLLIDNLWVHKTNSKAKNSITTNGFKLPQDYGRFGRGIYFSFNDMHSYYGEAKIKAKLQGNILSIWHNELKTLFPNEEFIVEESGCTLLEQYAKKHNYDAVEIKYYTEISEIVVYNPGIIKIIN